MSRNFKSIISTSLFFSLCFLPTLASADDRDDANRRTNQNMTGQRNDNSTYTRQNWNNNQGNYSNSQGYATNNRQGANEQDDDDNDDQRLAGNGNQGTMYNRQGWNDSQGNMYGRQGDSQGAMHNHQGWNDNQGTMMYGRQGWSNPQQGTTVYTRPSWSDQQGMVYSNQGWHDGDNWNRHYYGSSYSSTPRYYSGSNYYTTSPNSYNSYGYPVYQSYPADGYYYNTGHHGNYPYSQEYHDQDGLGAGVYFNVR